MDRKLVECRVGCIKADEMFARMLAESESSFDDVDAAARAEIESEKNSVMMQLNEVRKRVVDSVTDKRARQSLLIAIDELANAK